MTLCLAAGAAQAQALGQSYSASVGGTRLGTFGGPFSLGDGLSGPGAESEAAGGSDWGVTASADAGAGGTVTANTFLSVPAPGQETYTTKLIAEAHLQYIFTIEGAADVLVPVLLNGAGSLTTTAGGGAGSIGLMFDHDGVTDQWRNTLEYGPARTVGFTVNQAFYLQAGHIYSLVLYANATGDMSTISNDAGVGRASATVDPTFAFLDGFGSSYRFAGLPNSAIVSDPEGPISAAPEPATWALLVAGFSLAGGALRRRRVNLLER